MTNNQIDYVFDRVREEKVESLLYKEDEKIKPK